jgi:AcrR family transcriptional regulator
LSLDHVAPKASTRQRILEAAYACVARWGLSKTSIEDVSREAGLARSTLYRYFPHGREELIAAVVGFEYDRFFARLYEAVHDATTLEEVLERGLPFAHRAIVEHEVLQRVLKTEPELLLPAITVRAEGTIALVAEFLRPYLERHHLAPGVEVDAAADFLARMVLSYMTAPGRWDLADPEQLARLVRAELLGGIAPPD